jgi:hypothetical protein
LEVILQPFHTAPGDHVFEKTGQILLGHGNFVHLGFIIFESAVEKEAGPGKGKHPRINGKLEQILLHVIAMGEFVVYHLKTMLRVESHSIELSGNDQSATPQLDPHIFYRKLFGQVHIAPRMKFRGPCAQTSDLPAEAFQGAYEVIGGFDFAFPEEAIQFLDRKPVMHFIPEGTLILQIDGLPRPLSHQPLHESFCNLME